MPRHAALPLCLVLLLLAPGPAAAEHGMFEPSFREGSGGDVLVPGAKGLLRGHVDAYVDLVEGSFDMVLGAERELALRDAVETSFARWNGNDRTAFLDMVGTIAGLRAKGRAGDLEALEAGQRAFLIALDQRIHAAPREKPFALVTEALERAQQTAWDGVPPIKRPAAGAWLETTLLLSQLGRNEAFAPSEAQRLEVIRALGPALEGQGEALRERLRLMHRTWSLAKARWDQAPLPRRLDLRWSCVRLLARLLPTDRAYEPKSGPEPSDYVREAAVIAGRVSAFDAWRNVAHNPALALEVLTRSLVLPEAAPRHMLLYR